MFNKASIPSIRHLCYASKYYFSLCIICYGAYVTGEPLFILQGLFELLLIFGASNLLYTKNPKIAYFVNVVLLFIFNTEVLILCFSGQFLSMMMIGNIASFESLSGQFLYYAIGTILLFLFSFAPIVYVNIPLISTYRIISSVLLLDLITVMVIGASFSPLYSLKTLQNQYIYQQSMNTEIADMPDKTAMFYHDEIRSYTDLVPFQGTSPNIVLIFTEGLSQSIVEDERNIMPNVRDYETRSINFENYYNHTAATYRGIISQLYSGYQNQDGGSNSLISIQSILSDEHYNTAFINTEPKNAVFTDYLKGLKFDQLITSHKTNGQNRSLSDKQAYDLLFDSMEKLDSPEAPFFISMYTYGTHNTFDSPDEVFSDGDDSLLNKFYNLDCQFGRFMDRFSNSTLADNTIIIFTADHCTYNSEAFRRTFPDYERISTFLDRIPLFIYYKGVSPQTINANGKNSLDLSPTVLDFVSISAPNYFLGSSLFNDIVLNDSIETIYYSGYFETSRYGNVTA